MKKYKIIKTIKGYYLALVVASGIITQISPYFASVGLLSDWVDNYPDNIVLTK